MERLIDGELSIPLLDLSKNTQELRGDDPTI